MKKALFLLTFALTSIFCFGQTLQKGNLIGLHVSNPKLKEGVTLEEYIEFFKSKAIPAYDKTFPGMKTYLIKSVRGQDSTSLGTIYIFNSEADRNKYFSINGTPTELFNSLATKLADIEKEFEKYLTASNFPDTYNDWLVQ